jgi:hypothetical protein
MRVHTLILNGRLKRRVWRNGGWDFGWRDGRYVRWTGDEGSLVGLSGMFVYQLEAGFLRFGLIEVIQEPELPFLEIMNL